MGPNTHRTRTIRLLFVALLCAPSLIVLGAEDPELEQLRWQLQALQQRYEAQKRALETQRQQLQALEARVRELSATRPAYASPLTPVDGTQPVATQRRRLGSGDEAIIQTKPTQPARPKGQPIAQAETAQTPPAEEEEPVVKEARPTRGTEAIIRDQHALFERRLTIEPGISYARFDRAQVNLSGFLALDAIFLGVINLDEVGADTVTFDLTARYGLTDRLQVDFNAPFLYRETTFQSVGVRFASDRPSEVTVTLDPELGDVNAGLFYQVFRETPPWPEVVWNARFKAPTGTPPYGVDLIRDPLNSNLLTPEKLPSGNGVWTLSSGFSLLKTVDPAVVFANFSYFYNLEESFSDIDSREIQNGVRPAPLPGDIDLGDSFQYGFGMALALNERMSLSLSFAHRLVQETTQQPQGQPSSSVVGSDANIAIMNFGLTYALSEALAWSTNVGIGLTRDAPDVTVTMRFPYTF